MYYNVLSTSASSKPATTHTTRLGLQRIAELHIVAGNHNIKSMKNTLSRSVFGDSRPAFQTAKNTGYEQFEPDEAEEGENIPAT